jgi:hypothetical protein
MFTISEDKKYSPEELKSEVLIMLARSVAPLAEDEKTKLITSAPVIGAKTFRLNRDLELPGQVGENFIWKS